MLLRYISKRGFVCFDSSDDPYYKTKITAQQWRLIVVMAAFQTVKCLEQKSTSFITRYIFINILPEELCS